MTVYFEKARNRWRYDFQHRGARYVGECMACTTKDQAAAFQLALKRDLPIGQKSRLHNASKGWVYFISTPAGTHVKIGWARSVRARMNTLQTAHFEKLVLIGKVPGSKNDEFTHHKALGKFRTRGEWFSAGPEVLEYIQRAGKKHSAEDNLRAKGLITNSSKADSEVPPIRSHPSP